METRIGKVNNHQAIIETFNTNHSRKIGDTVPTDAEGFFQTRLLESKKSGFEGNLTKQQQEVLEQLKKKLFDPNFAFVEDAKRELDGDRFFLRFLRATMKDKKGERRFDLEEAFQRLQKTYKWRKEYDIDELQKHIEAGTVRRHFHCTICSLLDEH